MKKNNKEKRDNRIEILICLLVFILVTVISLKCLVPMFMPNSCRVFTTESGVRITTFGSEQCALEYTDGSAAMYKAIEAESGDFQLELLLRGEMPGKIHFSDMMLDGEKVVHSITLPHEGRISDCFKSNNCVIGESKDIVKALFQSQGTVFEVSQETLPGIMEGGIRYGLDLQDKENHSAVLAYADADGMIDAVQFTVQSKSSGDITNKFVNINRLESIYHKASEFRFSPKNQFFDNTEEYMDVFYLKDGTLTIKYDITLGNYIIYEFRTYGSMNQGFQGAFKTDKEIMYANNKQMTENNYQKIMSVGKNVVASLDDAGNLVVEGKGAVDLASSVYDYPWDKYRNEIKTIEVKEGVTYLPPDAFVRCKSLVSIMLPTTLSKIDNTFIDCSALREIVLPDGISIDGAFTRCTALEEVVFGNGTTEIGNSSFQDCSHLSSITLPKELESVGKNAFDGCSDLRNVYFQGTRKQWESVNIMEGNDFLKNAKIHFESH